MRERMLYATEDALTTSTGTSRRADAQAGADPFGASRAKWGKKRKRRSIRFTYIAHARTLSLGGHLHALVECLPLAILANGDIVADASHVIL